MLQQEDVKYGKYLSMNQVPMGSFVSEGCTYFKVYSSMAVQIDVLIFESYHAEASNIISLTKQASDLWFGFLEEDLTDKLYAYKIYPPSEPSNYFIATPHLIADPYSKHVVSVNNYLKHPKTKIVKQTDFDWSDDNYQPPKDPRDLVIYETHIKDMVGHPSAKTFVNGIYNDFREARVGGIEYLKQLGINAIEFLPLQNFGYFEPDFETPTAEGVYNTWNPYSINYWGYMTSFFMAPENIYASDASLEKNAVIGAQNRASYELKTLIKALHKENIAVLMDVVYNHASNYDLNPLKYLAKNHYFRLKDNGDFLDDSWTGNDIETRAEYARKLIIDSVKYWIEEYNIDGFRFDLAGIIDNETLALIKSEAEKIKPNVLIIAEPWGLEYKPTTFSDLGWSAWNDKYRNGFKGYHPIDDTGFIFGRWSKGQTRYGLENYLRGTLIGNDNGLFHTSSHSVNYLESHDGYTLADFIKIALDNKLISSDTEPANKIKLNERELKIAKLAAMLLFVSQGITMLHSGQEWARSKVVAGSNYSDENKGKFDADSYNKDNETNWLNFNHIKENRELYNYYKGLIALRLSSPGLRRAKAREINFKVYKDPLHITFSIIHDESDEPYEYFISLNGNSSNSNTIILPDGYWEVVADHETASNKTKSSIKDEFTLQPLSGIILRRLRVMKA